jgi:heptosyltransferase-2
MKQPKQILIRGPNWTGDLIMATPGFRALRAGYPQARITLHLRPSLVPLLVGAPWFDEVLPLTSHAGGFPALLSEARSLRPRGFDLGLCLPDSFSAALLMRAAGVAHIVGYRRGWRGALLHQSVPVPRKAGRRLMMAREHHVLGLVEATGCPRQGTHLELFVTEAETGEASRALEERGISRDSSLALLAPGASYGPSKLWPAESFAAVGDALAEAGASVAVIGTEAERELSRRLTAGMRAPVADLCGELSLSTLKAVVRRASVLVCNDAGARHLAAAFGVPCVVLMGPTALEKTNMNLERVKVFSADVSCRPCYRRECPIDHRCMTRIPADQVASEALPALAADAATHWRGATLRAWAPAEVRAWSAA